MVTVQLLWRGNVVLDKVKQNEASAVNRCLADAVVLAKQRAPVRTGALRNDISMKAARPSRGGVSGSFGNYTIRYALIQEIRKNYLRSSADETFPNIIDYLGEI